MPTEVQDVGLEKLHIENRMALGRARELLDLLRITNTIESQLLDSAEEIARKRVGLGRRCAASALGSKHRL